MILYDTKKWSDSIWKIFLSFHWGRNYKMLLRFLVIIMVYTGIVTHVNIRYFQIQFKVDPFFFSLLGLILSLFLVFRLNTSYGKWWEGRQLWGSLVNSSRTLSAYLSALLPENDKTNRHFFAAQIGNFAVALNNILRNDINFEEFDFRNNEEEEEKEKLRKSNHCPTLIASTIFRKVEKLYQEEKISDGDKINIETELNTLLSVVGSCERIKKTPIPFSHNSFFKSFISIYIIALPFGLVNSFLYFTIPASLLISYALLGVEIISEEIEDPFGRDANDLPIISITKTIRKNVYNVLGVEKTYPEVINSEDGSPNFKIFR